MAEWRIPLSDLDYGAEETAAVARVLQGKWLSMGPEVEDFEREFAGYIGVKHAIAVSNGTAAIQLSYLALGLGRGDEIIQPAVNFVAAANMTVAVGASPVLADIVSLDEPVIDPVEIERLITPLTRAVVVMHYGGYICGMAEIRDICSRYGLALIEDACHAVGARYLNGKYAGSLGDAGAFSFFSNKNLATGEGGMITTDRDDIARTARRLRSHGMTTLTWDRRRGHAASYDVTAHGYNFRLDEMRATLGRVQLRKLDTNNQRRRRLVEAYHRHLGTLSDWILPFTGQSDDSSCHLMAAVAPNEIVRRRVVEALNQSRIQTSLHYPCLSEFEAFKPFNLNRPEKSYMFANRVITLPLFPQLSDSQVEEICSVIKSSAATVTIA